MIRTAFVAALLLTAAACDRSATQQQRTETTAPVVAACNDVAVNPAASVAPAAAAASATEVQSALIGGPISPGTYDLARVEQRDGAPAWTEQVWETLRVADSTAGLSLDFAIARGSATAEPERFTALLREDPTGALVFSCGREGTAPASWTAQVNEVQLLLPAEGGTGQTLYVFVRRAG